MRSSVLCFVLWMIFGGWPVSFAEETESFKVKWNRLAKDPGRVMKVSAIPGEEVPEATLNLSFGPGSLISVARGKEISKKNMLEDHDILGVINRNLRVVKYCYCKALKRDPSFEGQAVIGLQIATSGQVDRVIIEPGKMAENIFGRCLSKRILKWRFPKFKGVKNDGLRVASIGYEFPLAFNRAQ